MLDLGDESINVFAPIFSMAPRIIAIRQSSRGYSLRAYRDHLSEVFVDLEHDSDEESGDDEVGDIVPVSTDRVERLQNFITHMCAEQCTIEISTGSFTIKSGCNTVSFVDIKEPLSYQEPPCEPYKYAHSCVCVSKDFYCAAKCCTDTPLPRRYLWTDYPPIQEEYLHLTVSSDSVVSVESMDRRAKVSVPTKKTNQRPLCSGTVTGTETGSGILKITFRPYDLIKLLENCKVSKLYLTIADNTPVRVHIKNKHSIGGVTTIFIAPLDKNTHELC